MDRPAPAERLQVLSFLVVAAITVLMCLLPGVQVPVAAQLVIATLVVAVVGIPHGALDLVHMQALARRLGRAEVLWGALLVYLSIGAAVILAWMAAPTFMLAAFLAATILHWGVEDSGPRFLAGPAYVAEVLLRGGMPILLPCAAFPADTAWAFSQLIPAQSAVVLTQAVGAAWPALPLIAPILIGLDAARGSAFLRRRLPTLLELGMVGALFSVAPPLLAFSVYFGLLHSGRFLARYSVQRWPAGRPGRLRALIADAWSMTMSTWILAAVAYACFPAGQMGAQVTMQILFIGLAALTFPHATLMMGLRLFESSHGGRSRGPGAPPAATAVP